MINTRQTKVKLILSCMMEKIDLKSGEVIAKEAAFHSKTEVNLESTASNELFYYVRGLRLLLAATVLHLTVTSTNSISIG